jgi:hypothetical protein
MGFGQGLQEGNEMMEFAKGKKNKLNVGDKVEAKPELVLWHATNLCGSYLAGGLGEFQTKDHRDVAGWLSAQITQKMPKGTILSFGSHEDDRDLSYIRVEFKTRYGKISTYVSEKDVKKVRK